MEFRLDINPLTVYDPHMKKNELVSKRKKWIRAIHFWLVRLPLIFILAPLGFVLEFAVTFPWRLAVALDGCRSKKTSKK